MEKILGIDVSKWNGVIDFQKVKDFGVKFAIIRAGYGTAELDPKFHDNIKGFNKVGIDVGCYWFLYSTNVEEAIVEANAFHNIIKEYKEIINYPVCADFEYDSVKYMEKMGVTPTRRLMTDIVYAFCNRLKELGWYVANYTNRDFINNHFYQEELNDFDVWYARWKIAEPDENNIDIWQYTSDGKVDGINSRVDMNWCYKDYPSIIGKKDKKKMKEIYCENSSVKKMVTTDYSNIREFAGVNFNKLVTVPPQTELICDGIYVIDEDGYFWYHICHEGISGFIHQVCFE